MKKCILKIIVLTACFFTGLVVVYVAEGGQGLVKIVIGLLFGFITVLAWEEIDKRY